MKEEKATHLKAYRLNKNRFLLVSHPHYPSHFLYCNRLCALICFHIRTIPLAFRRGGARSSRCTKYCHSPQPSQKDNNPSLSTMSLPPLSKGGGLTARHKLLLCCVLLATRPPFYSLNFYAVKTEGLLYTHQPLYLHNLLKSTSTASPHAKLASLVKGEVLSPEKIRATTGGIAPYPHQPSQTCTIPRNRHTLASLKAYRLNKNRSRNTPGAVLYYPYIISLQRCLRACQEQQSPCGSSCPQATVR